MPLDEKKAITTALNLHPLEVMQLTQVLSKLLLESANSVPEEVNGGGGEDNVIHRAAGKQGLSHGGR